MKHLRRFVSFCNAGGESSTGGGAGLIFETILQKCFNYARARVLIYMAVMFRGRFVRFACVIA